MSRMYETRRPVLMHTCAEYGMTMSKEEKAAARNETMLKPL